MKVSWSLFLSHVRNCGVHALGTRERGGLAAAMGRGPRFTTAPEPVGAGETPARSQKSKKGGGKKLPHTKNAAKRSIRPAKSAFSLGP